MNKDPKPNYHFLRDRNDIPSFTPTVGFGRNGYKGASTIGGGRLNLRE